MMRIEFSGELCYSCKEFSSGEDCSICVENLVQERIVLFV